jgi:NADP-dependent 3-hydroxy acid dehydrogenase YdfG
VLARTQQRAGDAVAQVLEQVPGADVRPVACDVSSLAELRAFVARFIAEEERLDVLVNNAGGALGLAPAAETSVADWRGMYESNVIGTLQVTQALLPALIASGAGTIVNVGSIAGRTVYEGGSGYTAAKHAVAVLTETLRLELVDQPVRVEEVAPGMVHTEEFSLTRFAGDQERADAVYAGIAEPLVAEDVAEAVVWMVQRPAHVNIDLLVIKPRAQAAAHKVHRER